MTRVRRAGLDVVASGLLAGVVAAALAGLTLVGVAGLGVGLLVVQVVLTLAWLAALDARGALGAFVIAVLAAATADVLVAVNDTADIGRAGPVLGVAMAASFLHQLARRPRPGVTMSLAATISALTFALCGAAFLAIAVDGGGERAVVAALLGAGAALAAARLADLLVCRPAIAPGSRRGVPGVVVGAAAAVAAGAAYGSVTDALGAGRGARLALIAAVIALIADVAVDAVLASAPPADERPRSALTPLGVLLPVVLVGPAAYVSGRILLG